MNALTAAGGFIRQIKAKTESDAHIHNLWKIVDNKLLLIEEIISGYNDYTHAISFKLTENVDINEFMSQLVISLAEKNVDRNFTVYLYKRLRAEPCGPLRVSAGSPIHPATGESQAQPDIYS